MNLINLVKTKNNKVVEDFFLRKRDSVIEEQKKKDEEDKTALMHAVIDGNLKMVKLL